jgi:hypothetical protein
MRSDDLAEITLPTALDHPNIERAIYDHLLAEVKAAGGEKELGRLEHGFREYYREDGEEELHLPGLNRRAWWDASDVVDVRLLEASHRDIRDELEQVLAQRAGFKHYDEGPLGFNPQNTGKGWNAFYLRWDCEDIAENQARCPRTNTCLRALPNLATSAFFSALSAGVHLPAHTGSMGVVVTVHLGLIVPEGCSLRVGDETRTWQEGKCLAFQDTHEHEARNESQRTRFNLMFDVWHPDLTPMERSFIERWTLLYGEWTRRSDDGEALEPSDLDGVKWWT